MPTTPSAPATRPVPPHTTDPAVLFAMYLQAKADGDERAAARIRMRFPPPPAPRRP